MENTKRFEKTITIPKTTKKFCHSNLYSMIFSKNGELFFIFPSKALNLSTTTTSVLVVSYNYSMGMLFDSLFSSSCQVLFVLQIIVSF